MDYCSSPNRKTYDQLSLTPVIAKSDLKIDLLLPWKDIFFRCSYANINDIQDSTVVAHGNNLINELGMIKEIEELKDMLKNE